MTKIDIVLPHKPHANQWGIINSDVRYNVIIAGRRFGKTACAMIRCAFRAPTKKVWWIMPTHASGQDIWRTFSDMFRDYPDVYINHSERIILFGTGGELSVKSADSQLRGAGLDHVVLDEAGFMLKNVWYEVISPMLLESKGTADILSTPNGRNYLYNLYQLALDPLHDDWKLWHYTSYDNPLIDDADIDQIRHQVPERVFKQEYLAEFLDGQGAVFRNLNACVRTDGPKTAQSTIFGVDWGKYNDYTVITVIDPDTGHVIDIDRFNQINWNMQRERLKTLARRYNPDVIWTEQNSIGDVNIDALQRDGLPVRAFTTTARSKAPLIDALAVAFENEEITIPDDPVLLSELQAYTVKQSKTGQFQYSAPDGMHDDMVISLALAWHGVANGQMILFFT